MEVLQQPQVTMEMLSSLLSELSFIVPQNHPQPFFFLKLKNKQILLHYNSLLNELQVWNIAINVIATLQSERGSLQQFRFE